MERTERTPQGGPLSPLLANVLLDEVDKELEKRGPSCATPMIATYTCNPGGQAGACWGCCGSSTRASGSESTSRRARSPQPLTESCSATPSGWRRETVKRRVASKAIATMKERVRLLTRRTVGRSISQVCAGLRSYLLGWKQYISGDVARPSIVSCAPGVPEHAAATVAANGRRWWKNSGMLIHLAFPTNYFDSLGVPRLAA